jgi:hypothetical protein
VATQLWVNRGTHHATLSGVGVMLPTLITWARQNVQDPVAEGGVQTQSPKLGDELGVDNGVER